MHSRLAVCLAILCLLLQAGASVFAFSATDANTLVSSYNSTFYAVNGTNGYFKDTQTGGIAYFWGQAEMIECVIDAYEWTSNSVYQVMITNLLNGFLNHNGSSWAGNIYNDDIMWAVIAFARGGQVTGRMSYCDIARANFDVCYARAWDTRLGGGLYWTTDNNTKNACVNGPGAIAACLLYQIYGDIIYWNKATNTYYWERSVLFNAGSGAISDAISTNGVVNTWASTYNQGTFIGAAHFLGQTNDATLAANYTMTRLTSGGILPEYGIAGNNSGFNAIFLRWMARFMKDRHLQSTYQPWLQLNATAAWNVRRISDNLSWCQWTHPTQAGANFYSWDCISSFEAMLAADPTQAASLLPVPSDLAGYWPLDEASGVAAGDASGNGNNGTVNGAGWNANGRINGCLAFNGLNTSVQINNPLSTDFTLAFWVKTTQAGGSGQWYNGKGLVDGDVPLNNNDFGTALVAGKFAFGVGNPDTTIASTASINDGSWHHCVAARQRATGLVSVYVDGTLQATGTGNRNSLNAAGHLLFGTVASGGGYFNGSLDEVKLFARALSSNEVAALYYSSVLPPSSPPAGLMVMAGNGRVELSWGEAPAATSYNLKRSLVSGGPYLVITNVTSTACTDTNVLNNRTYYYVVSAVNRAGESANSAEVSTSPSALTLWLKADALSGLANGSGVSVWPDSSGRGNHAVQPITANQPTFMTGAMNGLPVVRFNSARSTWLWFYRPVQDDFTMIFLYQSTQGIGTGTQFYEGAGLINGEVSGVVNDFGTSLNTNGQILAGTGNPDTTIRSSTGFKDGRPHVVTFKRTKATGGIALYVDGAQVAATIAGTQSLTAPNLLVLGAQQTLINFLSGDIAEVQIYGTSLSDSDRLGQERALKCKYGLAGGVTPAAPTGLTGIAGNRRISLNWVLSPGATSYNLWRSTNNGASYQLTAAGLTTSSYVDTNAVNGQTNYYRVAAASGCGSGANSLAVGIYLPLPELSMSLTGGALAIRWPAWASDWHLWSATNLVPPVAWLHVTNAVQPEGDLLKVVVPIGEGSRFLRLASP